MTPHDTIRCHRGGCWESELSG